MRERCAVLPDRRTGGNGRYTMTDIGLAAFGVFFMQSPSFPAHQTALSEGAGRGRGRSNAHTLFGMPAIVGATLVAPATRRCRRIRRYRWINGVPLRDGADAVTVTRPEVEIAKPGAVPVALNLPAFAMHNACDLSESLWRHARERLGPRPRLFEHLRSITAYLLFPSRRSLLRSIINRRPPPQPP